ncbi:MAG: hypothetical protein GX493_06660, partial [Firmicutes bacterium]|nr:hypothetical protein [Bacillota bacterium]
MEFAGTEVRRFFPGGNTAYGFYSFYDQIIRPEEARKIFVLKGGPGVGKSTFMRGLAAAMTSRGFAVELLQCSSDNDSLDGVVFPTLKVALLDGTAPHVVDPRYPGCVDDIITLGEYWDEAGLVAVRKEIIATARAIEGHFARAYRLLRAAKEIRDVLAAENGARCRRGRLYTLLHTLEEELFSGQRSADPPGRVRHLFASAITPDGPREYLATVFSSARRKIVLTGPPGTGKSFLLAGLLAAAVRRGFEVECFHCGFDPHRVEHLFIPELSIGLITANDYHPYSPADARLLALEENLVPGADDDQGKEAMTLFADLIGRAVGCLAQAKAAPDRLEKYYVPHMDFAAIDRLREKTLTRLLMYAG